MKEMVVCPNCGVVVDRSQLIRISDDLEARKKDVFDKIYGAIFNKNKICCKNCVDSFVKTQKK